MTSLEIYMAKRAASEEELGPVGNILSILGGAGVGAFSGLGLGALVGDKVKPGGVFNRSGAHTGAMVGAGAGGLTGALLGPVVGRALKKRRLEYDKEIRDDEFEAYNARYPERAMTREEWDASGTE